MVWEGLSSKCWLSCFKGYFGSLLGRLGGEGFFLIEGIVSVNFSKYLGNSEGVFVAR